MVSWHNRHCLITWKPLSLILLNLNGLLNDTTKPGVDVFLPEDGWFSKKYQRIKDYAGLVDLDVYKR
jgi:hypothetical protein